MQSNVIEIQRQYQAKGKTFSKKYVFKNGQPPARTPTNMDQRPSSFFSPETFKRNINNYNIAPD